MLAGVAETILLDDRERALDAALAALRRGDVVAVPTDTVDAVVCDAFQQPATAQLLALKGRGRGAPLPVVIRSPRQVSGLVEHVPEVAERLMASYWPGPLTIVFPAAEGLTWDLGDTDGSVALRMPAEDFLLDIVADVGPLACTGLPPGGDERDAAIAVHVDGGPRDGPVSTIVDVTRHAAHVLRTGAIPDEHVHRVADGTVSWGRTPQPDAAEGDS